MIIITPTIQRSPYEAEAVEILCLCGAKKLGLYSVNTEDGIAYYIRKYWYTVPSLHDNWFYDVAYPSRAYRQAHWFNVTALEVHCTPSQELINELIKISRTIHDLRITWYLFDLGSATLADAAIMPYTIFRAR